MGRINDIENLIQAVNEKYGLEPYNDRFPPITENLISASTVKRLWKYPSFRERAKGPSLDILARSVGYDSFKDYQSFMKNSRKVHKAVDGTIFTLFNKHQDILNHAIDVFVEAGYVIKDVDTHTLRWVKKPWKRQEFACWITEICYLVEADKEESYHLIKNGNYCEVSAQTFISSFRDLPTGLTDDNLREAVSQYRKQITHIHKNDLSSQYTRDEFYRMSVMDVLEKDVNEWYEYDGKGEIRKKHTLKKALYFPIIKGINQVQINNANANTV